ncbi:MAG: PGPGW domain-containing protein [Thermodesulfobacteriota bacterium]
MVAVVGGTVVLIGLAMVVLPGPATLVIPAGIAILATEFVWARRLLDRTREKFNETLRRRKKEGAHGVEAEREGRGIFCQAGVREEEEARGGEAQQAGC